MKETKFAYRHKDGKWALFYLPAMESRIYLELVEFDPEILYAARNIIEETLNSSYCIRNERVNPADFKLVEIEIEYKIPEN